MGWTPEQFKEFCAEAGVNPEEALRTGKVEMDPRLRAQTNAKMSVKATKREARKRKARKNHADSIRAELSAPKPESNSALALEPPARGSDQSHAGADRRTRVIITGHKCQPTDPDNFTGGCKALVDCLRASGLLEDDSWQDIGLETRQEKVPTRTKERTTVEIEYPD